MNIIIAGDGEVGMHLAQALEHGDHNITIVDPHEELLKKIESQADLMTIIGDSTSIKVLQQANVKKADLVIAVLHDEHINLLTGILAKKLGAKKSHRTRQHHGKSQQGELAYISRLGHRWHCFSRRYRGARNHQLVKTKRCH